MAGHRFERVQVTACFFSSMVVPGQLIAWHTTDWLINHSPSWFEPTGLIASWSQMNSSVKRLYVMRFKLMKVWIACKLTTTTQTEQDRQRALFCNLRVTVSWSANSSLYQAARKFNLKTEIWSNWMKQIHFTGEHTLWQTLERTLERLSNFKLASAALSYLY